MYVDQWGEIHPLTSPEKEKPLEPFELGGNQELGVDVLSDIGQKIRRYGTAKARNREMAGFLVQSGTQSTNDPYRKLSRSMYDCASWMIFHHYTDTNQTKLHRAESCKKHLLCPVCAIRRGAKTLRNYHERAMVLADQFDFFLVTLTVKNGPDLWERHSHLKHSFKRLRERGKKGYGAWAGVAGAVWSTEFTKSDEGWHPHLHVIVAVPKGSEPMRYGKGSQLSMDWENVTGDSFIVHVAPIAPGEQDIAAGLCEVLKYALKFSDLSLADNLHAYETLKGKRLIQAGGCFYGLDLPDDDDLNETPEDGPYLEMFFSYTSSGYRLARNQTRSVLTPQSDKAPRPGELRKAPGRASAVRSYSAADFQAVYENNMRDSLLKTHIPVKP